MLTFTEEDMPRFYIDTDDGDRRFCDDIGRELEDAEAARMAALDALRSMAGEKLPDGDRRAFIATVRDDQGAKLVRAKLLLTRRRKLEHQPLREGTEPMSCGRIH